MYSHIFTMTFTNNRKVLILTSKENARNFSFPSQPKALLPYFVVNLFSPYDNQIIFFIKTNGS